MKVIIASCDSYLEKTVPLLISSLRLAGFNRSDIVVALNSNKNTTIAVEDILYISTDSHIFEYVAFKAALKLQTDMFFLHDTCTVNKDFKNNIESFPLHLYDNVKLTNSYTSCGMGYYKFDYLKRYKDFINGISNLTKHDAIALENYFFKDNSGHFSDQHPIVTGAKPSPYGTNIMRIEEHYVFPGVIKYKSNWGANNGPSGYFTSL